MVSFEGQGTRPHLGFQKSVGGFSTEKRRGQRKRAGEGECRKERESVERKTDQKSAAKVQYYCPTVGLQGASLWCVGVDAKGQVQRDRRKVSNTKTTKT